jgi:hypothetical protein
MRVAILRQGGHIGEVRLLTDNPRAGFNPMYIPSGAGYMGHMICFPHFVPASPEERKNGLGGHGEAQAVEWSETKPAIIDADGVMFFYAANLPKTNHRIERIVSLRSGETAVHVEETVENLTAYDRPFNRDQHATFGAPFVAAGKNVLDMSGAKGLTDPRRTADGVWLAGREFQWPDVSSARGESVNLRPFRAVPGGSAYTPVQADAARPVGWFTFYNTDDELLVGYLFPTSDHPWIIDWQNQPRADSTDGTARGIEFGTSPFDEGLRASVERAQLLGTSSYRWIAAGQRLTTRFTIFLAQVPAGFAGVQDIRPAGPRITMTERGSGRQLTIAGTHTQ